MTRRSGRGTARQTIRVDEARWERFGKLAERLGTDRSTLIREQIDRMLDEDQPATPSDPSPQP